MIIDDRTTLIRFENFSHFFFIEQKKKSIENENGLCISVQNIDKPSLLELRKVSLVSSLYHHLLNDLSRLEKKGLFFYIN